MPKDSFGRQIDYLRISLTDHCNLRCVYCMPLQGLTFTPSDASLTPHELEKVVRAAADLGFRRIRLTGGEPTLRADLLDIVKRIRSVEGIDEIAMTTNAVLLPDVAVPLKQAGLNRVNIHVDSLNPARVRRVMRFASFDEIWRGICAAEEAGLVPIKINSVVVRDYNENDVVELARLTIERDWHVRFVELMPFGSGECARLSLSKYVPNQETRDRIETALGQLEEIPNENISDESKNFKLANARGVVGFISPVSDPYCDTCNRMRLTADGKFHLCLLNDDEVDVKAALRSGGDSQTLRDILLQAVLAKPTGHKLHDGISTQHRQMFQIGG